MVSAHVVSSESFAGKTLACLALGKRWLRRGLRVGYIKPLGMPSAVVGGLATDEDALFVAQELGSNASPAELCPVVVSADLCHAVPENLRARVQQAFATLSTDRDVMLVGGLGSVFSRGASFGLSTKAIADLLGSKVVLVSSVDSFLAVDNITAAHQLLGERLVGVIMNRVPMSLMPVIEDEALPCLRKSGVPVLGVLPEDPLLSSISVDEIAKATGGEFLVGSSTADGLVESFVVGAMGVDSALRYFRKATRKCVITGGDRTDIQFAALETPTRCMVLTGYLQPSHSVLARAREMNVPVLLVRGDTLTTVETIEGMLGKQRVREHAKMDHALGLFEASLDLARLDAALGL
jgi:BioD-like phosphotransacetylase family protein